MQKENLFSALTIFSEDIDLDNIQRRNLLLSNINTGYIGIENLKAELDEAISDSDFNWVNFTKEAGILINSDMYTNIELINYVKSQIWEYLYPEKALGDAEKIDLTNDAIFVLKAFTSNDGWMFSYDLFDVLKKNEKYANIEYYNLWKINFRDHGIERKPVGKKDSEIGYLRFKGSKA